MISGGPSCRISCFCLRWLKSRSVRALPDEQKFDRRRQSLKNHASWQETSLRGKCRGFGIFPLAMRERRNGGKKGPNGGKLPPAEYATRPRQDQRSDETIRTPSETRLRGSQIDESWSVPPPPQKANVTEPLVVRGHYTHNSNAMEGYFSLDRFSENSLIPEDRWFTPIGRSVSRMQ